MWLFLPPFQGSKHTLIAFGPCVRAPEKWRCSRVETRDDQRYWYVQFGREEKLTRKRWGIKNFGKRALVNRLQLHLPAIFCRAKTHHGTSGTHDLMYRRSINLNLERCSVMQNSNSILITTFSCKKNNNRRTNCWYPFSSLSWVLWS